MASVSTSSLSPAMALLANGLRSGCLEDVQSASAQIVWVPKKRAVKGGPVIRPVSALALYGEFDQNGVLSLPTASSWRFFMPQAFATMMEHGWAPLEDANLLDAFEKMPAVISALAPLCNPPDLRTHNGENLLHMVAMSGIGFPPKADWFRRALRVPTDINAVTRDGNTPMHLVLKGDPWSYSEKSDLPEWQRVLKTLILAGANLDAPNAAGQTAEEAFDLVLSGGGQAMRTMAPKLKRTWVEARHEARVRSLAALLPEAAPRLPRVRF